MNIMAYQAGSAYGLFISVVVPNIELAMALVPVLIIPLMVLGGFFISQDQIPKYLYEIEYISMFKYGFQAVAIVSWVDFDF